MLKQTLHTRNFDIGLNVAAVCVLPEFARAPGSASIPLPAISPDRKMMVANSERPVAWCTDYDTETTSGM